MVRIQRFYATKETDTYVTAKHIANVLASLLPEMGQNFRRADAIDKLKIRSDREQRLLTDALSKLKTKGLIEWNDSKNAWKNLAR